MIRRLVKTVLFLGVLGAIGLAGYAYFADLSPETHKTSLTVTLDAN